MIYIYFFLITSIGTIICQKPDFVLVVDDFDLELIGNAAEYIQINSEKSKPRLNYVLVKFEENIHNVTEQVRILIQSGADLVTDFTCEGLPSVQNVANQGQVPYIHVKSPVAQNVQAVVDYLKKLEAKDAVLMFKDKSGFEHAFCHVIDNVEMAVLLVEGLSLNNLNKLKNVTRRHSHYVVFSNKFDGDMVLKKAYDHKLMLGDSRWLFASQDDQILNFNEKTNKITILKTSEDFVCKVAAFKGKDCSCNSSYCFRITDFRENYYQLVMSYFAKVTSDYPPRGVSMATLVKELETGNYPMYFEDYKLQPELGFNYYIKTDYNVPKIGNWEKNMVNITIRPAKDFERLTRRKLKIGTILEQPFLFATGTKNYLGDPEYDGFNMDFLKELQAELKFDYEFVIPPDDAFGIYDNETIPYPHWNGLMGLSVNKSIDLILAPLSMTAERSAYVDYVTPYYDQTGIGILGRRPQFEPSLFKFMSVLTPKVWYCILGSVISISIAIWFVDKYSPYSGTNMGEPNCRKFTIRESLWFTLTSFTPQGGGEAPMSISGRVLVAVYWLFVVLILATFSANLSALLTVERMDAQINSLDEMAKESNFNYTTLASSSMYQYFQNMAEAEDEIYSKWRDATLKSGSDYSRYRVWDYPVQERYKIIFEKIKETGPVQSIDEGIKKVLDDPKGRFAFIGDINTVRFLVNQNCEFIQIGEAFGEHPYAIALTKGSSMLEEFSNRVMNLKRQRFFENKNSFYWNTTKRKTCNADKDNLGLYDLGGVFIAMAIGMSLALSALFIELKLLAPKKLVVHPTGSRDSPMARIGTLMPDGKVVHNNVHVCRPEPGCIGFRRNIKINTITW